MARETASKTIERTLDHAFDGVHRAAPHIIKAHKTITHKVILPAGLTVLSGAVSLVAAIVSPKRKR